MRGGAGATLSAHACLLDSRSGCAVEEFVFVVCSKINVGSDKGQRDAVLLERELGSLKDVLGDMVPGDVVGEDERAWM